MSAVVSATAAAVRPHAVVIAAIAASGTLAMHMFVPALPAVARDLGTSPGLAQLTLTVYLVGIAAGQLIYGPLSDRFGRRPVLIASLSLFLAATMLAAFAPTIEWLIAGRVLQALGACGGLVLGRAMARDGASPEQAARQLAALVMVMTTAPAIAPLLGGTVAGVLGWRGIFGLLAAAGAGLLVLALVSLPETNRERAPLPSARAFFAVYGGLLRQREFRAYAVGGACMSTSIYAFLSASPFLFTELLGRPASEVGLYYMAVFAGITLGSWLTSRLTASLGIDRLLRLGAAFGLAGAGVLLLLDLSDSLTVIGLLASMGLFAIGCGMASPVATARVIGVDPQRIGAASGLYGCLQMSFGALCTLLAGLWHGSGAMAVALILIAAAGAAWICFARTRG